MAPPSAQQKRKVTDRAISPPPTKRALQSTTTKSAVASFFTPTSQKPKERTTWSERGTSDNVPATLLVGTYAPEAHNPAEGLRRKIAAFDLDSTLITTSSGKKHADSAADWKWWAPEVPGILRDLYKAQNYRVVVISNQAGLKLHPDPSQKGPKGNAQKRVAVFKQKCSAVLSALDIPTTIYAATEKDIYRKPRVGMWKEICDNYDIPDGEVDLEQSFFIGDAGGRIAGVAAKSKDFSCSDRNFADNVGISYKTPEEFFLGESPRQFSRDFDVANFPFENTPPSQTSEISFEKKNPQDVVLFCGPPGAGKSTFFWKHLKPLGYERVNQDTLKSRDKCVQVAKKLLEEGKSIAVDNTNADIETRALWLELAFKMKLPVRCVLFRTPLFLCEHNDAVRAMNTGFNPESRQGLPKLAFTGFASRYREPQLKEGFQDIVDVQFKFRGSREEHQIWARYWT